MPHLVSVSSRVWLTALAALTALLAAGCSSVDLGPYYEPPPVRMPEPLPPPSATAPATLPPVATAQPVVPGQPVGQPLPPLPPYGAAQPVAPPQTALSPSAAPADAQVHLYALTTRLAGAAVNPPNQSAGTGQLDAQYDAGTRLLRWKASWANLSGTITGVQFFGPAEADQNGPPTLIWPAPFGPTYEGRATLTPPQADDLLAGRWYLSVFTAAYPAGELRGQLRVVP